MNREKLLELLVKYLAVSMGKSIVEVKEQLTLIGRGDLFSQQISMEDLRFAVEHIETELGIDVLASSFPFGASTLARVLQALEDAWVKKYGNADISEAPPKGMDVLTAIGGGLMSSQLTDYPW